MRISATNTSVCSHGPLACCRKVAVFHGPRDAHTMEYRSRKLITRLSVSVLLLLRGLLKKAIDNVSQVLEEPNGNEGTGTVMVSSGGRCKRRSLTGQSTYSESAATRTTSYGKNLNNLFHVAVGGGGGLLWTAAVLTGAQVRRVPVPPLMCGVRRLVVAVVLRRLVE